MSTNNAVNVPLSGNTGTGNFVGANTPTLITPILGVATATSLAFSPTTGGIIGTTVADNTTAGDVGEFISSVIASGSAVALTNNVAGNLTSISLTAGDWDVWGNITTVTIGTAAVTFACWLSTTSATVPDVSLISNTTLTTGTLAVNVGIPAPSRRFNVSTSTIVYISAITNASSGNATICGGIYARRRR
jgi:hypothetical protein